MQKLIGISLILCFSFLIWNGIAKQKNDQISAKSTYKKKFTKMNQINKLEIQDEKEGTGAVAQAGHKVSVHYTGTLYPSGEKFDSSLDRNSPFQFKLGAGQVIQGWDKGIEGMKVGGKRVLIIPPAMGYGEGGYPPVIPPSSTLKFEVELLEVQ